MRRVSARTTWVACACVHDRCIGDCSENRVTGAEEAHSQDWSPAPVSRGALCRALKIQYSGRVLGSKPDLPRDLSNGLAPAAINPSSLLP